MARADAALSRLKIIFLCHFITLQLYGNTAQLRLERHYTQVVLQRHIMFSCLESCTVTASSMTKATAFTSFPVGTALSL